MNGQELLDRLLQLQADGVNLSDFDVTCTSRDYSWTGASTEQETYPEQVVVDPYARELNIK